MSSFVHLHVHSEYSLLDGFSNIKKLVARAKELNMPAVGLTDHGTMFGVMDFYNAATAAGIKPILGVESYLAPRGMRERDPQADKKATHILLLAENQTGYQNLLQLASAAQLNGFYYYPRIDHELLAAHSEGLICTSGCMSAEVPRLIQQGNLEAARKQLDWYYETFGKDNFFLELQSHDIKELDEINKNLLTLGRRYDARFVATNDVHYINREDARLQDILLAIQTGCLLADPNRMRMTDSTYYLRTADEMAALFADVPDALSNTLLIAERCNVDLGFKGYHLPNFPVPEDCTAESYLRSLCEEGLCRRYREDCTLPIYRDRLEYELGVIHKMGFDTYFLIVWDLCRHARQQGIWYNARGSAAGSIVAYCLDITLVDPIAHGLIFERFLNPGRISMPDIDLDFRDDRRAEMLEYTARKYGDDKVAQIITFGTLGAKAAIRDVGRVMDIPLSEVDRVAKLIPAIPGKPITIPQALEEVPDLKKLYDSEDFLKELIDTAAKMEGVVRNAGTHAAGVVIADKPIVEYLPLHRPTSGSEDSPVKIVTQFEMGILEKLKMLKVDFLGLATLTIMARACDLIRERHGIDLNLDNIPVDDPATYELMGRGETAGVFQVEGSGMKRWLMQMKPKELANVIAMVALFRPGPMDFIPGYIRRMHGEEQVEYRHPLLEPIFKETYGYPVYQEQLMFAAVQLAGYTQSEADDLRKAIAKKIKDKLLKHREKFIKGASQRGVAPDTAMAIFDDWEEFARYGFNKCLPGDTEVVDYASGRLVRLEDLYTGQASLDETVACDTDTLHFHAGRVAAVRENGVKPVYRLTTALGRRIEATANHPFYTYDGWTILDHLQAGDLIATPRSLPVEGQVVWPEHEVICLGHLLAEGNLCHPHSVYFYSQSAEQVADFVHAAEQFENVRCATAMHKNTFSVYAGRADRKHFPGIVPWAQELGIWGKNARQKEIPSAAFELNNRQIGLLISRMWEGDGHIDVRGRSMFYATASERLARQLQHLLLRLGIVSRLRQVTFPYKDGRIGYQLFITNHKNIVAFAQKIGVYFISRERTLALESLALAAPTPEVGTRDIVPLAVKQVIRAAKERHGVTWLEMNKSCGVAQREFYPAHTATKRGFTRQTIGCLATYFDEPAIRRLADNDIYWDEIVAIEYVGEKQTYDLEIEDLHNFVANDILVHNSHAADYGIIAVQTGYLKVHYPVEYMTALLSVSKNETDKVALYAADCRRMGISVEPPSVNASQWDFSIEDCPAEGDKGCKSVIRFGLGAIKNVGMGPVEAILAARGKGGSFKDLNDFARRVDLRQVGKRALESMVKVGALDSFGTRPQLLAGLDQVVSVSGSHFKAADSGQMSLFGAHTGVVDQIHLPPVATDISRREILNWERELIGLYVSDHPLSPVMDDLTRTVSHFAGQLNDAAHGEKVRVAGMVTRIRNHQTKTGSQMAFATLEDIQGNIELVIFPRTWEKVRELVSYDRILVIEGKIDNPDGGEPKVLVDTVGTEFKVTTALTPIAPDRPAVGAGLAPTQAPVRSPALEQGKPAPYPPRIAAKRPAPPQKVAEPPAAYAPTDEPPPPDNFPPDWQNYSELAPGGFVLESARPPAVPLAVAPAAAAPVAEEDDDLPDEPAWLEMPALPQEPEGDAVHPGVAVPPAETRLPTSPTIPVVTPPLKGVTPLAAGPSAPSSEDLHMLTVSLRTSGDKVRDNLRLRQVFGVLISYPGNDRFAVQVWERGRGYLIEFPNFTTRLCPELSTRLNHLLGPENIRVEPILLH